MNVDMLPATSIHIAIPLTSCDGHKLQRSQLSQALSRFCPADIHLYWLYLYAVYIYVCVCLKYYVYVFLFPPIPV